MAGTLFIVATPIGNLADISTRALDVLRSVALIAVEDTRHSKTLLQHYGVTTPMQAYHDFNERQQAERLLQRLAGGDDIALISDAGTPLISDPGYQLVTLAHERGIAVTPVPGPSAVIAALSAAGLPSDRFCFEGFLPARPAARRNSLAALAREARTLIFYEAPHRILECLRDMTAAFGADRPATLVRELSKTYETILHDNLDGLVNKVESDDKQQLGEIVVLVAGFRQQADQPDAGEMAMFRVLLDEMPLKKAAALAARISGRKKAVYYDAGLALQGRKGTAGGEKD